jgi:thiol-disulfide isomerase/thioredoxin
MKFFKSIRISVWGWSILAVALTLNASAAPLKIGDPAPRLQAAQWVQGGPVQGFDSNHVYLIAFWNSENGACRSAIPRLNGIWEKYKDNHLVVIGQNVMEKDDRTVPEFVKEMGDKMTFPVALDDKSQNPDGAMVANWLQAAGQPGVPVAFIVSQQGKVVWIGHPLLLGQSVLESILAGQFDVAAFASEFEKHQQVQEQETHLTEKLNTALKNKDWEAADAVLTKMEAAAPASARPHFNTIRLRLLVSRHDFAGAVKLAGTLSDASPRDAYLQNEMAWMLVTTPGLDAAGLALAEKMAERANLAANSKNSGILDTLARAEFLTGKTQAAIATEQQALEVEPDDPTKIMLKKNLDDYQQGKLPQVQE